MLTLLRKITLMLLGLCGLALSSYATDTGSVLPNGNTADGAGVLISLTNGIWNSGFGNQALNHDTSGSSNTAAGFRSLFYNSTGNHNTATGRSGRSTFATNRTSIPTALSALG